MESNPHLLKYADKLQRFIIEDVVLTGKQLGSGAFGSVVELKMNGGALSAGKRIHDALVHPQNEGIQRIIDKFVFECELMSNMRHPNIVNFYGLCFVSDNASPILVMEQLDQSLDDYLERVQERDVPLSIRISILYDVAKGLVFLHTYVPIIVHRDLTARNILLTRSMQAKIADLGNSRLINPGVLSKTLSQVPGTLLYMPPEAMEFKPTYDASLDLFSFGHVALYVLGHAFPGQLLPATYPDSQRPNKLCARSEVERRINYFEKLKSNEMLPPALVGLTEACLDNVPANRPTSKQVSQVLSEAHHLHKDEYEIVMGRMRIDSRAKPPPESGVEYGVTSRRPSHLMTRISVSIA